MPTKDTEWVGSSLDDIQKFPNSAKREAGYQLHKVQNGLNPDDFKPMPTIGAGVHEIRVHDDGNNAYRVIYIAKFEGYVYVLHAFHKTTRTTSKKDIDLAKVRYIDVLAKRKKK